ncbi:hypothetical protein [Aggregatibacter kilianii]|uniref:hypothetical protein n=1 Tax=Aggregatibacter kilianii TaxID=2025884 RepID=UPI000D65B254|nr:hypothetical protein [Aggregatibacter kilianii]
MTKLEIIEEIEKLNFSITNYHTRLNDESVWLFLATLGCYGVSPWWVKIIALIFVFILFANKVAKFRKEEIPFGSKLYSYSEYITYIDVLIDKHLQNDEKKECLQRLGECNQLISLKSLLSKRNLIFLMCFIFWMITALVFMSELVV